VAIVITPPVASVVALSAVIEIAPLAVEISPLAPTNTSWSALIVTVAALVASIRPLIKTSAVSGALAPLSIRIAPPAWI